MSNYHYSYIYRDNYFYGSEICEMIDKCQVERDELRRDKLLTTSFAYDLKQMVLGLPRDIHKGKPKDTEYNVNGTIYKNGVPVPAEDTGRV